LEIADRVNRKGAHLNVLNLGMNTSTATGKLLLTVIGAIGQFEREIMLERQREGIAKAKIEGRYKGRVNGGVNFLSLGEVNFPRCRGGDQVVSGWID
jgi:DNA invertase Pin-like site-specific DNA recombinase